MNFEKDTNADLVIPTLVFNYRKMSAGSAYHVDINNAEVDIERKVFNAILLNAYEDCLEFMVAWQKEPYEIKIEDYLKGGIDIYRMEATCHA